MSTENRYSEADVRRWQGLHKDRGGEFSWREIGEQFGYSRDTVKNAVIRLEQTGGQSVAPPQQGEPSPLPLVEFPQVIQPPEQGWSGNYLDAIIQAQEAMEKHETAQTKVPVVVPHDLPYGVVFSGDWHIGGRGTDHRLLREYFDLWRHTPGLGVIGMGDYVEMFTGKMSAIGVKEHVMPPDLQLAAATDLIKSELSDTLLCLLKGNHDNWAGEYGNFVQLLAQRIHPKGKDKPGIPYLGIGGEVILTVGSVEYRLACWHRYPGSGAVNKGNNQRRISNDHNGPDVAAVAHEHYQFGELSRNGEVDQVRCRSGAMKVRDEHSRDVAGNIFGDTRMPLVIFDPRRNAKLYYADFRDGLEHLIYLRKRWGRHPSFTTDAAFLRHLIESA